MMFALGVIGAFLPVMPTTIFIILSVYFASKASPTLLEKLKRSEIVKEYYDDDAQKLSMSLSRKIRILIVVFLTLLVTFLIVDIIWIRILLVVVYLLKLLSFILIVKTKNVA